MEEIWKSVKNYEGLYEVSNLGRVKSINKMKGFHYIKELIMKQTLDGGYKMVNLKKDGKNKFCSVHRLVAEVFIDNPLNLETVNHKDEDKSNNVVTNLEWMTFCENSRYSCLGERSIKSKRVYQYKDGKLIKIWGSVRDIERELGINHGNINYYSKKQKPFDGFIWKIC
jgi:hypothetical protein